MPEIETVDRAHRFGGIYAVPSVFPGVLRWYRLKHDRDIKHRHQRIGLAHAKRRSIVPIASDRNSADRPTWGKVVRMVHPVNLSEERPAEIHRLACFVRGQLLLSSPVRCPRLSVEIVPP